MCGGDDFIDDHEDTQLTFKEYCSREKGFFKTLLEECNGRIILFNSRIKDEAVKYQQVKDLVTMVDQLPSKGERYTNEHFKAAEKERDRLYVTASVPMIEKETLVQHKIILDRIKCIQSESCEQKKIDSFKQLLTQIQNLIQEIETKDKGTGALKALLENVQGNKTTVNNLILFSQDCIRRREIFKAKEEKLIKGMSAEVRKIEEEFEKEKANFKTCHDDELKRFFIDLTNQESIYRKLKQEEHETFHAGMKDFAVELIKNVACPVGALLAGAVAGGLIAGPPGVVLGGVVGLVAGTVAQFV